MGVVVVWLERSERAVGGVSGGIRSWIGSEGGEIENWIELEYGYGFGVVVEVEMEMEMVLYGWGYE